MFKTKIMVHQTLEISEVRTFCPIRRANKSVSQQIFFCPEIVYMYNVLTMTAAFQVILEAEEDDNRSRLKNLECSETGAFALQLCFFFTDQPPYFYQSMSWKHTLAPPPTSGSTCRHIAVPASCYP